jgi:hypothetical protein
MVAARRIFEKVEPRYQIDLLSGVAVEAQERTVAPPNKVGAVDTLVDSAAPEVATKKVLTVE